MVLNDNIVVKTVPEMVTIHTRKISMKNIGLIRVSQREDLLFLSN